MEELRKGKNNEGHNYVAVVTDEGKFSLSFGEDHDLYIGFYASKDAGDDDVSFTITKENYYIFSIVDKLYNNVKNRSKQTEEIKKEYEEFYVEAKVPFENNQIRWISDDFENEKGSELIIKYNEEEDTYVFTFKKSCSKILYNTYLVKIDTIGSYYHPYSDNFIEFYQDLLDYNDEYHQIHIDEYLFNKSRVRK